MNSPVVETNQLTRIYNLGEVSVYGLREVNFSAYPQEIVGITGPSGSGKSTLLNLIGAIDTPTGGTISSCGLKLQKLTEKELCDYRRKQVGFIFQFYNLNPNLSVAGNLELPMILDRIPRKRRQHRVNTLLKDLNMQNLKDRPISVLSGGERQRVAVAVALVNKPTLILADEPTGELDSVNTKQILSMFTQLRQDFAKTVILVSHDPTVIQIADRVIQLKDGRLSE